MKLHVFNPEHDIALAYNRRHQTMPHAAQELRMNLGWIPALWAEDGDVVLVDDVPYSVKAARHSGLKTADVLFLAKDELKDLSFDEVLPWGWDLTIVTELEEAGVEKSCLPDEGALIDIRHLSNRRKTVNDLQVLRMGLEDYTCGESAYITTLESGRKVLEAWKNVVIKAPWSSSGRGKRTALSVLKVSRSSSRRMEPILAVCSLRMMRSWKCFPATCPNGSWKK